MNSAWVSEWSFDPLIAAPLIWSAITYTWGMRRYEKQGTVLWNRWHSVAFFGGIASFWIALLSPIEYWSDRLLFIHMFQHLLLIIVAPPLILMGRPVQLLLRAADRRWIARLTRATAGRSGVRLAMSAITYPAIALLLYNANLVFWHLPGPYDAALEHSLTHRIEHLAFLASGMLFWWTLVAPVPRHHRAPTHWLFFMSLTSCVTGGLIGAALTISPRTLYSHYATIDRTQIVEPLVDQQIGGAMMWLAGALYFAMMFVGLYRMVQPQPRVPSAIHRSDQPAVEVP